MTILLMGMPVMVVITKRLLGPWRNKSNAQRKHHDKAKLYGIDANALCDGNKDGGQHDDTGRGLKKHPGYKQNRIDHNHDYVFTRRNSQEKL